MLTNNYHFLLQETSQLLNKAFTFENDDVRQKNLR